MALLEIGAMIMIFDGWQLEVLDFEEGNFVLCSGRQVGKSEICALKTARFISGHPNKRVLVVSVTEDQAELMLARILGHLFDIDKKCIAKGKDKPTKHKVVLNNKSWAVTKALGATGAGLRGGTYDVIVIDEAAYVPSDVIAGVLSPMLLTTGGFMWLLSTPNAMEGYFWDAYSKPEMGFKVWHVTSLEVAENRPEPLRSVMLAHLERERVRMSPMQFAQQYLAQFQEELGQLFCDDLIRKCQVLERPIVRNPYGEYYLGVDFARLGGDENVFSVFEKLHGIYIQRELIITKFKLTTDSIQKILDLNYKFNFKEIYIDSGGLGAAIYDQLLLFSPLKSRVVPIDNSSRAINQDKNRSRKILKEDLYLNLLAMMEKGEIQLLKDAEIFTSLKSIMLEHDEKNANIKIYGRYSHVAESLIRAAWSNHNSRLNLWAR